ncbi:MAG: type II toxin-antitoxin system VapC family toxin [Candidatus Daviesbacteria bacterium]|nr:type II toxin-antitoxin system VapC family toxin [Candidatus Daviesbacteria bacterium]
MLIDTNILIYAINEDSPKHKLAKEFLSWNKQTLVISHQVILEAIRVLTHPRFSKPMQSASAVKSVSAIAAACQIIIPNYQTYYLTLELINKFSLSGNRIFDAYLASTAITNEIYQIATDNVRDFKKFKEVKVVNPFN